MHNNVNENISAVISTRTASPSVGLSLAALCPGSCFLLENGVRIRACVSDSDLFIKI